MLQLGALAESVRQRRVKQACKAGTFQPSLAPVQSQVNDEGEGDSRMFNFVRESPHEQGVDCIRRIDSKGHLCGELLLPLTCSLHCLPLSAHSA